MTSMNAIATLRYEVWERTYPSEHFGSRGTSINLLAAFADRDDADNFTVSSFGTRDLFVIDRAEEGK